MAYLGSESTPWTSGASDGASTSDAPATDTPPATEHEETSPPTAEGEKPTKPVDGDEQPITEEKPKDGEPEKPTEEKPTEEPEETPEETAKISKGYANLAKAQKKFEERKREWESRASTIASQLETKDREISDREAKLAEREKQIGGVLQALEAAKAGDFDAFFTLAEQMGCTAEAAQAWLAKAPTTPEARAQQSVLEELRKEIAELRAEKAREKEEAKKAEEERKAREAEAARQREFQAFIHKANDAEKYPYALALYRRPEAVLNAAIAELQTTYADLIRHGLSAEQAQARIASITHDQILEYLNSEAEKTLKSDTKLHALLGLAAPQPNGHGGPASKPATARTITQSMTTTKATTTASPKLDEEEDWEADVRRQLREAKARDRAAGAI
jgi:hypothetical protein